MTPPPKLAVALLTALVHRDHRESFLGDVEEQFQEVADLGDVRRAVRWYWCQVALSIIPLSRMRLQQVSFGRFASIGLIVVSLALVATVRVPADAALMLYVAEAVGLLSAAFGVGFLFLFRCRTRRAVMMLAASILLVSGLFVRCDPQALPWMVVLLIPALWIGIGCGCLSNRRRSFRPAA